MKMVSNFEPRAPGSFSHLEKNKTIYFVHFFNICIFLFTTDISSSLSIKQLFSSKLKTILIKSDFELCGGSVH